MFCKNFEPFLANWVLKFQRSDNMTYKFFTHNIETVEKNAKNLLQH